MELNSASHLAMATWVQRCKPIILSPPITWDAASRSCGAPCCPDFENQQSNIGRHSAVVVGHKGQFRWQSRSGSPLPNCRSEPLRQAAQCRHRFHPIEARMDRSASSDCSFLTKRRVERNQVRGDTFLDDVVKILEIDPTSDSSPWGRRASASLQPGETTFDADQTAREFWQGKTPTRAPTLSEFQRYMVERIKAYFQVRCRCDPGGGCRWPQFRCPGLLRLAD